MLISHGQYSRGNLGKPVPECQTVLDSAAATDDGGGDVDNWRSKMCKAPVRSHNIAHFFTAAGHPQANSAFHPSEVGK